ncbi:small integral membrane protein 7 isoform X1 [Acomys russatus]|uniref:small integral membrane protein 7 isoform X1 n=1 Tax=Acomys russatus TaxID=60746 RepID=UPI0021E27ABC|nr:small integral membrane protein 7 isoform X1 [Acomys russatus]
MIGDILLFGTLLMNAGAVLNFKLRQHPGVLTEPAVLPDLHRPVECVHDALHDSTVRFLSPPLNTSAHCWMSRLRSFFS